VRQIGRGIMNTPEALRAGNEQQVWDQERGLWVDIDLAALEAELDAEGADSAAERPSPTEVTERDYYELLQVEPNSTPAEIRKAYRRQALLCHPDKNPEDTEDAKVKFQKLTHAFQVLSDPDLRKMYDREGRDGVRRCYDEVNYDILVFFTSLFGSGKFEPWIGWLDLAQEMANSSEQIMDSILQARRAREVRMACHLRDSLDRFVCGRDSAGFEEEMEAKASDLASGLLGPQLLIALGEMYQLRAAIYVADEIAGRFSLTKRMASMRYSAHKWYHRFEVVRNTAVAAKRASGAVIDQAFSEQHESFKSKLMEREIPRLSFEAVWAFLVTNLDGTVREACRKLLKDKSVVWQIRVRRAQALQRLGQIFSQAGIQASEAWHGAEEGAWFDDLLTQVQKMVAGEEAGGEAGGEKKKQEEKEGDGEVRRLKEQVELAVTLGVPLSRLRTS